MPFSDRTIVMIRIHWTTGTWRSNDRNWTLNFFGALNFLTIGRLHWRNPNSSAWPNSSETRWTSSLSLSNSLAVPEVSKGFTRSGLGLYSFEHRFEVWNMYHLDPLWQYGFSYDSNKKKRNYENKVFKLPSLHINFLKGRTKFFTWRNTFLGVVFHG